MTILKNVGQEEILHFLTKKVKGTKNVQSVLAKCEMFASIANFHKMRQTAHARDRYFAELENGTLFEWVKNLYDLFLSAERQNISLDKATIYIVQFLKNDKYNLLQVEKPQKRNFTATVNISISAQIDVNTKDPAMTSEKLLRILKSDKDFWMSKVINHTNPKDINISFSDVREN